MKLKLTIAILLLIITNAAFSNFCDDIYTQALKTHLSGNYKTALSLLEKYKNTCGKDAVYYYLKGETYFLLKEYYKAFKSYLSLYGNNPRYKTLKKRMLKLAKYFLTSEQYIELAYPIKNKIPDYKK